MSLEQNILKLHYLYNLEMFGEDFCDEFPTHHTSKKHGVLGHSPNTAKVGFITQTPLLDENLHFLPKKSATMLEDMITKVFFLNKKDCCILSLFKTQQTLYDENLKGHIKILLSQILQSPAQTFIVFGTSELANHLFGKNLEIGNKVKFKNKNFIITHSFGALIKLTALKRQTLEHLKIAKALI